MSIRQLSVPGALALGAICWLATPSFAQATKDLGAATDRADKGEKGGSAVASDTYDQLYERYLSSARAMSASPNANINWMVGLSSDRRARGLNDLVTIHVVENLQASGTADAELNKSSAGSVGVPHLFGIESKLPSAV